MGFAVGLEILQFKHCLVCIMDLAHVVTDALDLQPLRIRRHHAPAGQVVQSGAPEHGFFTPCVHGDVAAYAGGLGRGRVHRKHKPGALSRIGHALRDDARLAPDGGHFTIHTRQSAHLHRAQGFELFGVDDHALPGQRHRAAGVAGAAAAWNDGQLQVDTAFDQPRHFLFTVGREHHKRVFHTPVGGIGHMRHPAQAIKLDVAGRRQAPQHPLCLAAQSGNLHKSGIKSIDRRLGRIQQSAHQ